MEAKKPKVGRALRIEYPANMPAVTALKLVTQVLENFPQTCKLSNVWTVAVGDWHVISRKRAREGAPNSFIIRREPKAWKS